MPSVSKNPSLRTHAELRTRADLQAWTRSLVTPVLPGFSAGRAAIHLGENRAHYGDPAGGLEGFSRPLWGLVPLAAGAGAGSFAHWDLWRAGLAAGSDPAHPEFWGLAGDFDQRSVEQAAFGFALALAPHEFWHPLPRDTQTRLAAWLRHIDRVQLVRSNWLFFRVIVHLGLRAVGEDWSPAQVAADLDIIETFYLGDGWYSDGGSAAHHRDGRLGDYYVPMALHFYGLIYAKLAADHDPARASRFKERAARFALDFQHYFAADGSALPFGRSLAYRFAQGAFWGALAYADVEALPWPVIKGLLLRHLRWWAAQPTLTDAGRLSIGYAYPNLLMAESYNSSASPYWALKALLPLALPETHPFWLADEAPPPPRPAALTVPGAGLVLTTDPRSRDVVALNPGQPVLDWPRHAPHKYSKFTYGTRFAFAVPSGAPIPPEGGFDQDLALAPADDERHFRRRDFCLDPLVHEGVATSVWRPWPDVEVRTWLLAAPTGHLRLHRVRSARRLLSLEAGFAVPYAVKTSLRVTIDPAAAPAPGPASATVRTPRGASTLVDLLGARAAAHVELGANSHLLASLSAMPVLRATHEAGEFWLAARADGAADPDTDFAATASDFAIILTPAPTPDDSGCTITHRGQPWWTLTTDSPLGHSSDARLRALSALV